MDKAHNKLVRDKIPEIIKQNGGIPVTRILTEEEYIPEIGKKFAEESSEYVGAPDREERLQELCDILQLVHDAAASDEATIEDIETLRLDKFAARGGFSERIYLERVDEAT